MKFVDMNFKEKHNDLNKYPNSRRSRLLFSNGMESSESIWRPEVVCHHTTTGEQLC